MMMVRVVLVTGRSAGFVLIDNLLPQSFIVQVIVTDESGTVTVERMSLDEANRGELTVPLSSDDEPAVLVITALARHTTIPAVYDLSIRLRDLIKTL